MTYTVDSSNASVLKNGVSSSVGNISVGDMVMVAGSINGANVTATTIRDGVMKNREKGEGVEAKEPLRSSHAVLAPAGIQGNGQPVIGGTVTAVNGSILTVTNKSNVTYTVDVTSATINKGGTVSSLANVIVGETVVVQGMVTGTSVVASSVIDKDAASNTAGVPQVSDRGFFGCISNFFHNIFGF